MSDPIECTIHGQSREAFVCAHLAAGAVGLGFNRDDPTDERPFPDAWCDDCELVRAAHNGWNAESEALLTIKLFCSGCYEQACIRNTRTAVTLADLADLRWKCGNCEEWHEGPCLDFGYRAPDYWGSGEETVNGDASLRPSLSNVQRSTFLDDDYCVIANRDFFVRGIIHLPIIGTAETFRWGVWGTLSPDNFKKVLSMHDDPKRTELRPMFSWLSSSIPEYPETLNLKMSVQLQELGQRPYFKLEATDHPLCHQFHHGISPERIRDIMVRRLGYNLGH